MGEDRPEQAGPPRPPAPEQAGPPQPEPPQPSQLPPVVAPPAPYQRPPLPFAAETTDVDPGSVRPSRRWFLAPGLIAGFVVVVLVVVLVAKWSALQAYSDESWVGPLDQGVPISAHADQRYVIYTFSSGVRPPTDCTLRGESGQQDAPIDTEQGFVDVDSDSAPDGTRVFWLGAFVAAADGEHVLTCPDTAERAWVHADDRAIAVVVAAALLTLFGLLLAMGLTILIAVLRTRDRRGRRLAQRAANQAG